MAPWIFVSALGASLLVCVFASRIGRVFGVIDHPDGVRKAHGRATPLVGGVAIIAAVVGVAIANAISGETGILLPVASGIAFGYFLLGFADDRYGLRPALRLLYSVLLTLIAINLAPVYMVAHLDFSFAVHTGQIESWHIVFTCMAIVGFISAFNMVDGMNGLASGLGLIWTGLLIFFVPESLMPLVIGLFVVLAVVMAFNLKGRIFLGDSGAYVLAILIALLSIASYNHNAGSGLLPADVVALWFLVPVVDCLRLMVTRLARGLSPAAPDRNHLHHVLLMRLGWPRALAAYLAMVGIPSVLAAIWPAWTVAWAVLMMAAYAGVMVGFGTAKRSMRPAEAFSPGTEGPGKYRPALARRVRDSVWARQIWPPSFSRRGLAKSSRSGRKSQ